jgi:hypothetical protein
MGLGGKRGAWLRIQSFGSTAAALAVLASVQAPPLVARAESRGPLAPVAAAVPPLTLPPILTPRPTQCSCPSPSPTPRPGAVKHPREGTPKPTLSPGVREQVVRAATATVTHGGSETTSRAGDDIGSLPALNPGLPPSVGYAASTQTPSSPPPPLWPAIAVVDALGLAAVFGIARRGRLRRAAD